MLYEVITQFPLQDRRRNLRKLNGVGTAHTATGVALKHLGQLVPGFLEQLTRRLIRLESPFEMAGIVIGDLAQFLV